MKALILRTSAITAATLLAWAAPATAAVLPEEPAELFLKEHRNLPLDVENGAAVLDGDADLWTLRAVEALQDLGEYQIVHDATGRCLTADTSGGEETVPAVLADCADAIAWTVVYNDTPSAQDLRFVTADGYFLGLADDVDPAEDVPVLAVDPESDQSRHSQEWRFAVPVSGAPSPSPSVSAPPSETTSGPPPNGSDSPSGSEAPSSPPPPKLPTTGAGVGAAVGAGAVAVAGGAALVMWLQRRRALRGHW
ncbi:hypothetical protein GCM10009830_21140 [Glycomyces endophyticus]|uniref:Ricin B lectin domain-containing protein n=1 Tax=Glycomyces endophyticus TaxID=480996 RepID=A0ABN2GP27_9ACTN